MCIKDDHWCHFSNALHLLPKQTVVSLPPLSSSALPHMTFKFTIPPPSPGTPAHHLFHLEPLLAYEHLPLDESRWLILPATWKSTIASRTWPSNLQDSITLSDEGIFFKSHPCTSAGGTSADDHSIQTREGGCTSSTSFPLLGSPTSCWSPAALAFDFVAQLVNKWPAMQKTWVWSLSWGDPLEKGKATHSSILTWRIPWTYSPWGCKEWEMTERLSLSLLLCRDCREGQRVACYSKQFGVLF